MYIQRKIHLDLKKHLNRKEYTIITGPRQCGKTSLIKAIYKELQDENKQVDYITFEDQDILSAINIVDFPLIRQLQYRHFSSRLPN